MNISFTDTDGNISVGRYVKTPEERQELLNDVRKWRAKPGSKTGNNVLLALETVLVSAVTDDQAAAEAAKAQPTAE